MLTFEPMSEKHPDTLDPYLSRRQEKDERHGALWSTNADFPVRHLAPTEGPDDTTDITTAIEAPPLSEQPSRGVIMVAKEELSPYNSWLLTLKPPVLRGKTPPLEHSRVVPAVVPEEPSQEKKKKTRKKKKGQKKKSSKQKGQKHQMFDASLITDTLAEITADQGHTEEAIEMYRLLVSQHPDKAPYYLDRIRALKQEGPANRP